MRKVELAEWETLADREPARALVATPIELSGRAVHSAGLLLRRVGAGPLPSVQP